MQAKLFKDSKNEPKESMNPSSQKEYFIKQRKSSDLTSVSFCPTDDISITSESFFIPNEPKQSSYINDSNEIEEEETKENVWGYFQGIERYFRMKSPEKFEEYKFTSNYLPKRRMDIIPKPRREIIESPGNCQNAINMEENIQRNIYPQMPMVYYPVYQNLCFYMYNNFFFNNNNAIQMKHYNINEKVIKEEKKDTKVLDNTIKQEENKEEEKKNDDIEIIKTKKYNYNHENDYYMKKKKYQNYNKIKYHKYEETTYNYKDNHYYNNKSNFEKENIYKRNQIRYWNNYNEDYKYKGNVRRRNKNYYENNLQRKKYYN